MKRRLSGFLEQQVQRRAKNQHVPTRVEKQKHREVCTGVAGSGECRSARDGSSECRDCRCVAHCAGHQSLGRRCGHAQEAPHHLQPQAPETANAPASTHLCCLSASSWAASRRCRSAMSLCLKNSTLALERWAPFWMA